MAQFIHIPFGGGGGGGSSEDRFAPKYLVGNTNAGDPDTASTAGLAAGFNYYPDPGDGSGIFQALTDASAVPGDVWIRPGTYTATITFTIPPNCTVRGAGQSTVIQSSDNVIPGPLFSLSNGSSLRDVRLIHNNPAADLLTQYGVVDLRGGQAADASASCENVSVRTATDTPTQATLFAGFSAWSQGGYRVALALRGCSVEYGFNSIGNVLANFLCGYRSLNAALSLDGCSATAILDGLGNEPIGYPVVATSAATNVGQSSLDVRGGRYVSFYNGIVTWGQSGPVAPASIVNVEVLAARSSLSGTSDSCVYQLGRGRLALSNSHLEAENVGPCVTLNPAGQDANCTGQIHGNTLIAATGKAWNSLGSGLHTILGNLYREGTPSTTSPNDEEAHNIAI